MTVVISTWSDIKAFITFAKQTRKKGRRQNNYIPDERSIDTVGGVGARMAARLVIVTKWN